MSDRVHRLVLALLVLAAVLPHARLGLWPMTTDGALWVARSLPTDPAWLQWDLASPHFIGYRPVTALSFTATGLLGTLAWPHRLLDLALHGLVVALTAAVGARLSGSRGLGLIAAGVVALHPASAEVVPWLARRSYSLGLALALGGVLTWLRERGDRPWDGLLPGALMAAGLLANETAGGAVVLLPLLGSRRVRRVALAAAPVALAVALRTWVLAGVGGYGQRLTLGHVASVLRRGGHALVAPGSATEEPTVVPVLLAAGAALWLVSRLRSRAGVAALAWGALTLGLYAAVGNWSIRQAYPLIPALALVAVLGVRDGLRFTWSRWVTLGAAAVLAVSVAWWSPVIRGLHPELVRRHAAHQVDLESLDATLDEVPDGAAVRLLAPLPAEPLRPENRVRRSDRYQARRTAAWLAALHPELEVQTAAVLLVDGEHPELERGVRRGADCLLTPPGLRVLLMDRRRRLRTSDAGGCLPVDALGCAEGCWVVAAPDQVWEIPRPPGR